MKKHLLLLLTVTAATISAHAFTAQFHAGAGSYGGQSDFSISEASDGAGVTLPTPTLSGCSNWEFAGWIVSGVPYELSDELTQPLYKAGSVYRLTSISEDFYAVYRNKSNRYHEIYVNDQLVSGDQYLVVNTDRYHSLYFNTESALLSGLHIWAYSLNDYSSAKWAQGYIDFEMSNDTYKSLPVTLKEENTTNHYWSIYNAFRNKYIDFDDFNQIDSHTGDANCTIAKADWESFNLRGVNSNTLLGGDNLQTGWGGLFNAFPQYDLSSNNFYILSQQAFYTSTPDCSLPNYTVTFNAGSNGTVSSASMRESGYHQGVVLPAATPNTGGAACNALWEFAGWTESGSALAEDATELPKRLWLQGEVYYPGRDETLHAVYRRKSNAWEQVEDPNTLQAGEKIIIACPMASGYYVLSSAESSAGYNASIVVGAGEITALNNAASVWTLEGTKDAWRLKDSNGKHLDLTRGDYAYSYTYPWSRWSDEFTISGATNLSVQSNYAAKHYLAANGTNFFSQVAASNVHIFRQVTKYSKTPKCENYTVLFNSGEGTISGVKDATVAVENVSSETGIALNDASVPVAVAPDCEDWRFAGWRVGSGLNATTDAPGVLYKTTDTYIPMQDSVTLYAVYQNGGNGVYYERITYATEIVKDGVYVIATTGNQAVTTTTSTNGGNTYFNKQSISVTDGRVTSAVGTGIQWTFDGTRFKGSNNKYLSRTANNTNYPYTANNATSPFVLKQEGYDSYLCETTYKYWGTTYNVFGGKNTTQEFYLYKQKTTAPHNSWPHCTPFEVELHACGGQFAGVGETKSIFESIAGKGVALNSHRPTSDCGGWSFVGWVEKSAVQARNAAPIGMIAPSETYNPKQDKDKLYAVYSNGSLWSSYPACGEGIEIVEWMTEGVIVESYSLTGTPSVNGKNGSANSDGTYTLSYDVTNNPCTPLLIEWNGVKQIFQTPLLVNGYTRTSAVTSAVTNCSTCDMVILNGGTAIADETKTVRDIKIYPGGRFNLASGKTFTANSLTMRTNGDELAPAAVIQGTFNCSKLNHDRRIDNSRKYWFALPYDVTISQINYASPSANNGDAVFDDSFYIKFYDGIKRATDKGTSGSYWTYIGEDLEDESYQTKTILKAGRGYLLSIPKNAQNSTGHTYRTLRFPMNVASWASETSVNKTVAAAGKSCDWPQHIGWNLIGNPFLQNYSAVTASDLACGKLTKYYNDKDEWVEPWYTLEDGTGTVPYVTIYDPSTDSYTQTEIIGQNISPFSAVFVQLPDGVTGLRFNGTAINKQSLAARRMGLMTQEEDNTSRFRIRGWSTNEDVFTLIINDKYDDAYEVGADLMKMQNVDRMNLYSHHANGVACAFDALNYTNADSIPVGFVQPADGQFMIRAEKVQIAEDVEHLWLIDNETQTKTDLLTDVYTFTADKGTYNSRLWISIGRRADVPTAFPYATELNENSTQKIILNGQMYIIRNGQMYDAVGRLVK